VATSLVPGVSREDALNYLFENRGTHFDPNIIDLFFKHFVDD